MLWCEVWFLKSLITMEPSDWLDVIAVVKVFGSRFGPK